MGFEFKATRQLITGGASGLGLAFAKAMISRGAQVIIADINAADLQAAGKTLGLAEEETVLLDVTDHDAVEACAEKLWDRFGRIDGVFNNAGVGPGKPFLKTSPSDFDFIFGVNVRGLWSVARVMAARLVAQDSPGLIVNTASEHALGVPHINNAIYTASKHAVLGLSDVMRSELPDHIQVSVFCPGLTQSGFWDSNRSRPQHLGGQSEAHDIARSIQDLGMRADVAAQRALDAIESGAFYILTHPHNKAMVDDRYTEMTKAFEAQSKGLDSEQYDVNRVLEKTLGPRAPARPLWARKDA